VAIFAVPRLAVLDPRLFVQRRPAGATGPPAARSGTPGDSFVTDARLTVAAKDCIFCRSFPEAAGNGSLREQDCSHRRRRGRARRRDRNTVWRGGRKGEMEKVAKCQCNGFRVVVTGDPSIVNVCHCTDCQRRTGSPLSANAYFNKADVRLEGEYKVYSRPTASGRQFHTHFCPNCGSTLVWTLDIRPDDFGVAVGSFNDPGFPIPTVSDWESSQYHWVTLPPEIERFSHEPPPET
jgi:hypothetical protein